MQIHAKLGYPKRIKFISIYKVLEYKVWISIRNEIRESKLNLKSCKLPVIATYHRWKLFAFSFECVSTKNFVHNDYRTTAR